MKSLLPFFLFAALAAAQQPGAKPADKPKDEPTTAPLSKEVALTVQNISLRLQLLRTQFAAVEAARVQLLREVCSAQGFDLDTCQVDETAGTVSGKKPPAKK